MKPLVKYLGESIRFTLDGAPPLRERLAAFLAEQHLMIGDFRALDRAAQMSRLSPESWPPKCPPMTQTITRSINKLRTKGKKDRT